MTIDARKAWGPAKIFVAFVVAFYVQYLISRYNLLPHYLGREIAEYYLPILFSSGWSYWNELVAFGVPEPLQHNYILHPAILVSYLVHGHVDIPFAVALLAACSMLAMYLLCHALGMRQGLAVLCTVSFAASEVSARYLLAGWEAEIYMTIAWLMVPIHFYALVRFIHAKDVAARLAWITAFALLFALAYITAHTASSTVVVLTVGVFILVTVIADRARLGWYLYAAVLVFLIALWKNVTLFEAWLRFPSGVEREGYQPLSLGHFNDMFWGLFFRPVFRPSLDAMAAAWIDQGVFAALGEVVQEYYDLNKARRWLFFGPPFAILCVLAVLGRTRLHELHRPLAATFVVALLALCLPVDLWLRVVALPQHWSEPITFFGIILAGLTLQRLFELSDARARTLAKVVIVAQLLFVVFAMGPRVANFVLHPPAAQLGPNHAQMLGERVRALAGDGWQRIYYAPMAGEIIDGGGSLDPYQGFARLNVEPPSLWLGKFYPERVYMLGTIRGQAEVVNNRDSLNVLGVSVVVATASEPVGSWLRSLGTFTWRDGTMLRILKNDDAWMLASVLIPPAAAGPLARRPDCGHDRLMCADFGSIARAQMTGEVIGQRWLGDTLTVDLKPASTERTLFVSQMYHSGWRADGPDGPLKVIPAAEAFVGVQIPPSVTHVRLAFAPLRDRFLMWIMVGTIAFSCTVIAMAAATTRYRGRHAHLRAAPRTAGA